MLERLIQLEENLKQIVIDTACAICARYNLGTPRSYGDCLRLMGDAGYVPKDLARILVSVVGLRNLLIHEYVSVDEERIMSFLNELDVFRRYATVVRQYLET
ncbi:type VII toxin-antitoxin system HepT family RNase toxin [Gracilinema caldarium]|uniref:type VII toxin-antitoxin system HepT family RNase toxin n=1 Tax=Gracilinema caldarium TaxID=215591 RepID=UPI00068FFB1E|nr:HepT-like ribonuclease domain-containing protein [Gracilinema caldarium]